ncbi:hypothetical protein L195_g020641, partial [Trifolium pratense]
VSELRLICPGSHSTICPNNFLTQGAISWILMGRSLLIQDRDDVFSGGLEAGECLSKNDIRSIPLLGGVCFET